MDQLRWILLGVAIVIVCGVYFFNRTRKKTQYDSPLDAANDVPSFSADDDVANVNEWIDGVGPVKVVSRSDQDIIEQFQEEIAVPHPLDIDDSFSESEHDPYEFDIEVPDETLQQAETMYEVEPADEELLEEHINSEIAEQTEEAEAAIDDVIAVFIMVSPNEPSIKGEKILSASYALNLHHGDMKIFHRYADIVSVKDDDDELLSKNILFSMANMNEPGWFDFEKMHEMETAGVSFFMQANLVDDPSIVLDEMLICAHRLATMIGASLCNEQRKPLDEAHTKKLREKVKKLVELKARTA